MQLSIRIAAGLLSLTLLPESGHAQVQEPGIVLTLGRGRQLETPWPVTGVSVTDPYVADVQVLSPTLVLLSGKSQGVTDVNMWDDNGRTWERMVRVEPDLSAVEDKLNSLLRGCRLSVSQSQDVLVVSGTLQRAHQALQLHKYLDALEYKYVDLTVLPGVQQVQVKVRMAEVSRAGIRALGINAFGSGNDFFGASTIGSSTGGPINPVSIGPADKALAGNGTPFTFNGDVNVSPAVTMFAGFPNTNFVIFLKALAEDQYLRFLAEPTLIALSGEEASFLAGGEFPIPVVQGGLGGAASVTIEYKEFGVALRFKPTVLGDNGIELDIASEVSELTDIGSVEIQGFKVPAVMTRRADTTLQMKSGQTFAMAGLISEKSNAEVSKTPFLGSLPILGTLFRSVRYSRGETELVVMVTVDLVEPISETKLPPLPGTTHLIPDDWELFMEGRIEGQAPARLAPDSAEWLRELGLDDLQGPGAWGTHGQRSRIANAQR